ncbi:hypothetical protein OF376_02690 [Ureaplasma miroungigenitalium]|uniref:Uncharacterized protein n=1 Tax=Ureaplasma miroungigenitalium TaxID=1042321 RepID=A0ABT3BN61_9BACT|nr:hypothetical protein [Ureaplasma miroungigenitalium]MCV3728670.1 hypothetical protein [Ureaplasma miroungigenitalium]MCV3734361.1 hypothetical protein [Ureaplasma miroungigenitalium]
MYICLYKKVDEKQMLKVQTAKPLLMNMLNHSFLVAPDLKHNPFKKVSLIDLDKVFVLRQIKIPKNLCTSARHDISWALYTQLTTNLQRHPFELYNLNPLIMIICNRALMVIND